jgi:peptide/nickel transport system substrate-binding protein
VKPVLTSPFGFPYLVLNTKQGPLANLALRQAVEAALNNADMMGAGFGDPKFYTTEASHYARNTPFYRPPAPTTTARATPRRPPR